MLSASLFPLFGRGAPITSLKSRKKNRMWKSLIDTFCLSRFFSFIPFIYLF